MNNKVKDLCNRYPHFNKQLRTTNLTLEEYFFLSECMGEKFKFFGLKNIYTASEHGFSSENYHRKVDGVSNTITIITVMSTEGKNERIRCFQRKIPK